jgi:hypothetical protein
MKQFFLTPNRINEFTDPITRPPSIITGQVVNERSVVLLCSGELDNDYYDVLLPIRRKYLLEVFDKPPIQWVTGALSLGVKRPVREADHSPPPSAEVKKMWICTSTPPYAFMAWCLIS